MESGFILSQDHYDKLRKHLIQTKKVVINKNLKRLMPDLE